MALTLLFEVLTERQDTHPLRRWPTCRSANGVRSPPNRRRHHRPDLTRQPHISERLRAGRRLPTGGPAGPVPLAHRFGLRWLRHWRFVTGSRRSAGLPTLRYVALKLWDALGDETGASMSDHRKVDEVVSGVPYVVTLVNGRPPESLNDFVAEAVVAITVAAAEQVVIIHGSVRRDGDAVVIYEKDNDGIGKDVRTWRVGSREVASRRLNVRAPTYRICHRNTTQAGHVRIASFQ